MTVDLREVAAGVSLLLAGSATLLWSGAPEGVPVTLAGIAAAGTVAAVAGLNLDA